jgi:hypothetical protein
MKTDDLHLTNKHGIWIYVILIMVSASSALFVAHNIKISPDSMRFGLISEEILSGNGIRVPIIRLLDTFVPVNGAIPFLDNMPFFPILISLMGGIAPQNLLAGQIVNVISHVFISVLTFLIMKNLYGNKSIALLTGILVSISFPMLKRTHHLSGEPLFLALTAATIYFLILSRNSDHSRFSRNLVAASFCASVAILTRNAGIALIPVFIWTAFILLINKRSALKYVSTIWAVTLPIITAVAMFARNYLVSGSLRGFNQASPERSYLDAVTGTLKIIFMQFQLGKNAVVLIVSFMTLLVLYILLNSNLRKEILKYFSSGLDFILVFIFSYTALICLTMAKQQWNFEIRYVSPLVPFLFISSFFVIVFVCEGIKFKRFPKLSLVGMILFFSIIALGSCYKTYLNLPYFLSKQINYYSIQQSCTYKWLKDHYGSNMMITTNKPYHLSFFGGYSTIALPHRRFNPTINMPVEMESVLPARMSKFGSSVLALFEEVEEQYEGGYIARLFNRRENNDKFSLVHKCSDGVIYNLRE